MELFVTIFDSFHSLKNFAKISILDVGSVLNQILITDIFASQSWILISLRSIPLLYRNWSINSNGKEDGWLLWDRNILISNSLGKQLCTWQSDDCCYHLTSSNVYTVKKMCSRWHRSQFNKTEKVWVRVEILCLIFRKLNQINIQNRGKWQPLKIMRFFLTFISHTQRTIKSPYRAAINWDNFQPCYQPSIVHAFLNAYLFAFWTWYMINGYFTWFRNGNSLWRLSRSQRISRTPVNILDGVLYAGIYCSKFLHLRF